MDGKLQRASTTWMHVEGTRGTHGRKQVESDLSEWFTAVEGMQ